MQISTALFYISQSSEIVELCGKRERRFKRLLLRLFIYFSCANFLLRMSFYFAGAYFAKRVNVNDKNFSYNGCCFSYPYSQWEIMIVASLRIKQGFWEV